MQETCSREMPTCEVSVMLRVLELHQFECILHINL